MKKIFVLPLLALSFLLFHNPALSGDSKEVRNERRMAHKDRQTQKKERSQAIKKSIKSLKDFSRQLKADYKDRLADIDTELQLKIIDLDADHKAQVAEAEAEYQKKIGALFTTRGLTFDQATLEKLQADGKAYADDLFLLKRKAAEKLHQERLSHEKRKNRLKTEMDNKILEKADSLGINRDYSPILATPIGGSLTRQEERWNEREANEVAKIMEKGRKLQAPFRNGEKLRNWELENQKEDFKLIWDEKAELHTLDARLLFYNTLFLQAAQGREVDQQAFMSDIADINKEKRLINIKYKKISDQNRVKRRERRKEILALF